MLQFGGWLIGELFEKVSKLGLLIVRKIHGVLVLSLLEGTQVLCNRFLSQTQIRDIFILVLQVVTLLVREINFVVEASLLILGVVLQALEFLHVVFVSLWLPVQVSKIEVHSCI